MLVARYPSRPQSPQAWSNSLGVAWGMGGGIGAGTGDGTGGARWGIALDEFTLTQAFNTRPDLGYMTRPPSANGISRTYATVGRIIPT